MKIKPLVIAIVLTCFWLNLTMTAFASTEEDKNVLVATENTTEKAEKAEKVDEKNTKDSKSLSVEEQMFLLNEKVRKLEELVEKQQRVIEVLQTKASETNTPRTNTTIV
ncbi:MAG: hypothetical protein HY819_13260, partial [Acidobacteria bacterium]|nr:hypothetical protein [Acidobacteriota bacterium]